MKDQEMPEKSVQNQAQCEFCGAPVPVIETPMPVLDENQEASWATALME